jgi:hypothetical protein
MTDRDFEAFAEQNLSALEDLSRMYGEYRINVCESFWKALSNYLEAATPHGYSYYFEPKPFDKMDYSQTGERTCGWRKDISELIGCAQPRHVHVLFGSWYSRARLARGEWPIFQPWTGIFVGLESSQPKEKKS